MTLSPTTLAEDLPETTPAPPEVAEPSPPPPPAQLSAKALPEEEQRRLRRSLTTARIGALMPVGGLIVTGATVLGGMAANNQHQREAIGLGGMMLAVPLIFVGPPLLTGGAMRARTILNRNGVEMSNTAGWISWGCLGALFILPSVYEVETRDGPNEALSTATVWAEGGFLIASYGAGLAQLALDLKVVRERLPAAGSASFYPMMLDQGGLGLGVAGSF